MAIIGQNSLLNQYTPTFYIKDLYDGQGLLYDATRKAFVNADISGGGGSGSVRSVSVVSANGISGTVANPTTTPAITLTLDASGVTAGTFGSARLIPVITVNSKGLINTISEIVVDTTVSDVITSNETITVLANRQYIVTSQLEVSGHIVNNGRIAIL